MRINIKTTHIELTPEIEKYIEKRLGAFNKFLGRDNMNSLCEVEVGKTTEHHKSGNVFKAEVNLTCGGKNFYAVSEKSDLYSAIDEVKDEILQKLKSNKEKRITIMKKGALKIKNLIKGLDFWK